MAEAVAAEARAVLEAVREGLKVHGRMFLARTDFAEKHFPALVLEWRRAGDDDTIGLAHEAIVSALEEMAEGPDPRSLASNQPAPDIEPGATFGRWTVLRDAPAARRNGEMRKRVLCRCTCGLEKLIWVGDLQRSRSLGCSSKLCMRGERPVRDKVICGEVGEVVDVPQPPAPVVKRCGNWEAAWTPGHDTMRLTYDTKIMLVPVALVQAMADAIGAQRADHVTESQLA